MISYWLSIVTASLSIQYPSLTRATPERLTDVYHKALYKFTGRI